MKVNKTVFKTLVKECLLEILSEGLNESGKSLTEQRKPTVKAQRSVTVTPTRETKQDFSQLTSDPTMQEIFAHTANTTLLEQLDADRAPSVADTYVSDPIKEVPVVDSPQNKIWNTLAFAKPKSKR